MISVRPPIRLDTTDMARLLNEIVEAGGTTARTRAVLPSDIEDLMDRDPARSAWHVALDDTEKVVGFQWIEPSANLPPEAAEISTFVQIGRTGLGIGSALFAATRVAAKGLGYAWINANIRADNEGGLIYYQSRGFESYGKIENYTMDNGQVVDKDLKRYSL